MNDDEPTETDQLIINKNVKNTPPSLLISVRFLLAFLIFLAAAVQYMQKIDMSVSIVCMVNNTNNNLHSDSDNNSNYTCLFKPTNASTHNRGEFHWNKRIQGLVLSSYFYGYLLTQIISGWLSLKFGGKTVLAIAMFMGSFFTLLAPISARFGYIVLIICRFLNGIFHGMVWPAISDIFIRWVPTAEKSRLIGFSSSGSSLGNIIALPLGSYLCVNGFDNGWGSIFYVIGIIGMVWFVLFVTLTSNSPLNHKFISKKERDHIIANTDSKKGSLLIQSKQRKQATPWRQIFLSSPCIAIYFSHFATGWGTYLFLTQLPTFMNEILKFDIESNGLFSTLPYIASWFLAIISGLISDKLIDSQVISRKTARRIFNTTGLFVPVVATFILAFVDCSNPYLAVALLTIGVGFLGCTTGAGYIININEVGGIYSGILFGISNTFATITGIVAPYIVGLLTVNKLQSEWRIVFFITCAIYLIGGLIFLVFCDGKPQSWAVRKDDDENVED